MAKASLEHVEEELAKTTIYSPLTGKVSKLNLEVGERVWQLMAAFAGYGVDLEAVAQRCFAPDEILPWEHLGGPTKPYLLTHYDSAAQHL